MSTYLVIYKYIRSLVQFKLMRDEYWFPIPQPKDSHRALTDRPAASAIIAA